LFGYTSSTAVGGAITFAQDAGPAANALTALWESATPRAGVPAPSNAYPRRKSVLSRGAKIWKASFIVIFSSGLPGLKP